MPSYDCGPSKEDLVKDFENKFLIEKARADNLEKELKLLRNLLAQSVQSEVVVLPDNIRNILESISESVCEEFQKRVSFIIYDGALTDDNKYYLEGYLDALRHSGSISLELDTELKEYIAGLLKTDKGD